MSRLTVHAVALALLFAAVGAAQEEELKEAPRIPRLADVWFEDDFEGDKLADHWEVVNPDTDAYVVEEGVLLVIAKAVGGLGTESIPNIFRLRKDLPPVDWVVTLKLEVELQTGRELLQFGLFTDPANRIVTELFSAPAEGGTSVTSSLSLRVRKVTDEQATDFTDSVWSRKEWFRAFAATVPQPITVKMAKQGRSYHAAVHFDGSRDDAGDPIWSQTQLVSSLRPPKQLVLNVSQWRKVPGESLFRFDSIKIEANHR